MSMEVQRFIRRKLFPGMVLCLSLVSCQFPAKTLTTPTALPSPTVVIDAAFLSNEQFEAVLGQPPVNALQWQQETGVFGNPGVIGFADVFVVPDNALALHGIGQPAVLTTPTQMLKGYYLLGSGFELPHTIRIMILLDNRQTVVRMTQREFPYVTVPDLAPGERTGFSVSVPMSPGWHTLHFVLLADTGLWYEDSATRIVQRFSFAASRYEIHNGNNELPLLLDASDLPEWVDSTHRDLGGIQVLDANTSEFLNEWESTRGGRQQLQVQAFHQPIGSDEPLSLPVRWLVFVNDQEVDSLAGTLDRTADETSKILLDVNLGSLVPDDQLMVMAIPYPDTALTMANGQTLQYGIPVFSQRIRVR